MQSRVVLVDSIVLAHEIAKVSPGPEERAKWNIKPEEAVGKTKYLEVNSPEGNFCEVLPSRFVRPKLALVAVAADFLKDTGKSAAFFPFLGRRQFAEGFGDDSRWKGITAAMLTNVRRKAISLSKEAEAQ
jgi:hypothetical protein